MIKIICPQCNSECEKNTGAYNRAIKIGAKLFCSHQCAINFRKISKKEKVEKKRLYDIEYRRKNKEKIKRRKALEFQRDYKANPEKYRAIRKARMAKHVEYCRQPDYRAKKRVYDREYRAKRNYGEYWESHVAIMKIKDETEKIASKYERDLERGMINKAQNRRREYEKVKRGNA